MSNLLKTLVTFKTVKGTSFVGVRDYTSKKNEIAHHTFLVGVNYIKALEKDVENMKSISFKREILSMLGTEITLNKRSKGVISQVPTIVDKQSLKDAYFAALTSLIKRTADEITKEKLRLENDETIARSDAQNKAYTHIEKGVKVKDDTLYVYGMIVRKTLIKKGEYKTVCSALKTVLRKKIENNDVLRAKNYRQFIFDNMDEIRLQGITIKN